MAKLTQTWSLERGSYGNGSERCLRDQSFSSYLSGTEECYVIDLSNKYFTPGDVEIDIFSAEKYFNESFDDEKPQVIKRPPGPDMVSGAEIQALSGASSVHSVSSWNSQSALLQPEHRNPSLKGASRAKGRSYLGSFRCRCVCSDKNSVAVEEYQSYCEVLPITQSGAKESVKRGNSPITAERQCMANQVQKREANLSSTDFFIEDLVMKPSKSLEVVGPALLQRGNRPISFDMDRKMMLNWEDGSSRSAEVVIPSMTDIAYAESDSDSSSDLFEIEDFNSKEKPFQFRNMSDSTMQLAYAPSEASIEWSVVTASAADFPNSSDYVELRTRNYIAINKAASKDPKVTATGVKPRRLYSSFMACNSQNSVNVVANDKITESKIRTSSGLPMQVNSANTETKLTGYEKARNKQIGNSTRSVG